MHDLYIVSDLHMGRGKNPETRRFFTLENFFYDDDFARFCDYLCRAAANSKTPFKLIFNGDTFDLLRIDSDPEAAAPSDRERRFGPSHTPVQAARTIAQIMAGHPAFVHGLAQVLNAGHAVVMLPGNHDIEVQWAPVQAEIRRAVLEHVRATYGESAELAAAPLLQFAPWFYHEPGRIWVEHGCQYDPDNAFRYPLRGRLIHIANAVHEIEHDLPLGNFFQRYLYNFFGHITFIVPSTRANLRYVKWLLLHEPRILLRVAFSHLPFFFQVLRRLGQATQKEAREALQHAHEGTLTELAQDSGLGARLHAIDGLKEVRADAVQAIRTLGRQLIKAATLAVGFSALTLGLWYLGLQGINELRLDKAPKILAFLFLNFITVGAVAGGLMYTAMGNATDISPRPLRKAAQRIASILDLPIVTFGHSHDEEMWWLERPSGGKAWYCNTGTWIAVFTHDVLIPRERVQYSFLRVQGELAELMYWDPGRGDHRPVVLLDEAE